MAARIEVQTMRPAEIIAHRDRHGLIFLPLAPLEWHGPHLPLGVDPLRAYHAAMALARNLDGLVYPTVYAGTERERSAEMLRNIGFRGDEYITGMDFPDCALGSLYFPEEVFALLLRTILDLLITSWSFRRIVIVNGHGGENHLAVIARLCREFEATRGVRIVHVMPMENFPEHGWGHATLEETETLLACEPDSVDLAALPPADTALENRRWAIVDDASFRGRAPDAIVAAAEDPRQADPARGRQRFERTLTQLTAHLETALAEDACRP